jgi:hypothetical protein
MNIEKDNAVRPLTLEAVEASIEASVRASEQRLATKIDESVQASESRLSTKIGGSFDELARMAQEEFKAIDQRFNSMDKRFDAVDERFNIVDLKLVGLQNQIDNVYTNYTVRREHELLSGRVSKIERKLNIAHR